MSYEEEDFENYGDEEQEISEDVKDEDLLYNILSYKPEFEENENSGIDENPNSYLENSDNKNTKSNNTSISKSKNTVNSKSKNIINSQSKNIINSQSKINQKSKSPYKSGKSPTKNENSKSPNKNKKTNTLIKPFIASKNKSSSFNSIKITINACSFFDEYMMPIWCPENAYIKFRVEGKWRIDKLHDYTDSKGIPSNNSKGFNYGALIGRIGACKKIDSSNKKNEVGGQKIKDDQKFVVADEACIFVKKEGPLFLRPNLPKKMKIAPEGKLIVNVYDAEYKEFEEINSKIGWNEIGNTDYSRENAKIIGEKKKTPKNIEAEEKDLEQKLNKQLNNLRMNPCMFYDQYYSTKLIKTKEFLKKYDKNEKERKRLEKEKEKGKTKGKEKSKEKVKKVKKEEEIEIKPLEENGGCYELLLKFFQLPNQISLKKKLLNKNNINENLTKLDEDIEFYLYDEINQTVKVKSKMTQLDNQNEIIFQYLLDKKYRENIFDSHGESFLFKVFKNFVAESTLIILVIVLDNDYLLENKAK